MPRNKRAGKYARNAVSRAKTAAHVEHDDQNDFEGDSAQVCPPPPSSSSSFH